MEPTTLVPEIASTRIGFGCAGLMREASGPRRRRLLEEAYEQGIRHFDVARMYGLGAAERELGRFAQGRRESIVIATKFGIEVSATSARLARLQDPARWLLARYPALRRYVKPRSDGFHAPRRYDAATARASLETSLRELGTDYVDLLLLHDPSPTDRVDVQEVCAYLESARQAGHVRAWGVAGERDPSVRLKQSLPSSTLLQLRDDVVSRVASPPSPVEPAITFGVLAKSLERITSHLARHPHRRSAWSEDLGIDCASTDELAGLLLRDALLANRSGVVLYSTTRPERLREIGTLAGALDSDDPAIAALRFLVASELALTDRIGA